MTAQFDPVISFVHCLSSRCGLPHRNHRLRLLGLPSLVYRRFRGDAIEVYKHVHGLYRSGLAMPLEDTRWRTTRGHCLKLKKNFCKTNVRKNFFVERMTESWNRLPAEIVNAPSVNCFKGRFDRHWEGHQYDTDPEQFYRSYKWLSGFERLMNRRTGPPWA